MRQFDVYASPGAIDAFAPALLLLSSHLVTTRRAVVAPPMSDVTRSDRAVDIEVRFAETAFVLGLSEMVTVEPTQLRRRVGSLADQEDEIRRALDRLFTGF